MLTTTLPFNRNLNLINMIEKLDKMKDDSSLKINSRHLAKILDKPHNRILSYINKLDIYNPIDFKLHKTTYTSIQNKVLPCYMLPKYETIILLYNYVTINNPSKLKELYNLNTTTSLNAIFNMYLEHFKTK